MMTDLDLEFLLPAEAAAYLRISKATLAQHRVIGGGPRYFKVGRRRRARVLYRRADLAAWLKQFAHASTAEYSRKSVTPA